MLGAEWGVTGAAVAVLVSTLVFAAAWLLVLVRLRAEPQAGLGMVRCGDDAQLAPGDGNAWRAGPHVNVDRENIADDRLRVPERLRKLVCSRIARGELDPVRSGPYEFRARSDVLLAARRGQGSAQAQFDALADRSPVARDRGRAQRVAPGHGLDTAHTCRR